MANHTGHRPALRTRLPLAALHDRRRSTLRAFLPLAALSLAACAVPDSSEGAEDHTPVASVPAQPTVAKPASDIPSMIVAEAVRQGPVPPALALAVAKVGSNMASSALGAAGTVGTMQIPPRLAAEFNADADDLRDAEPNIRAGIAYLAALQARYAGDWRLALSHYRGGPLQEMNKGLAPHQFTRPYVRDVLRWWRLYRHGPLVSAWLRKAQGLPRFGPPDAGAMPGLHPLRQVEHSPAALAPRPATGRAHSGGRWRAVTGGARRFR